MIQITVSHRGLTELLRNLNNVPCQRLFVDAANRAVVEVHKWSLVEVPKRTHQLMKSHIIRPAFLNVMSAEVYTEKEYAVPVHEGHRIVAFGKPTGKFRRANPWMERAFRLAEPFIDSIFSKAADDVANALVK